MNNFVTGQLEVWRDLLGARSELAKDEKMHGRKTAPDLNLKGHGSRASGGTPHFPLGDQKRGNDETCLLANVRGAGALRPGSKAILWCE